MDDRLALWAMSMAMTTRSAETALDQLREAAAVLLKGDEFTAERDEFNAAMATIANLLNIDEEN